MAMKANQDTRLVYDTDDTSFWQKYPVLERFKAAANTFVKKDGGTVQIWAASRDWFLEEWGRDTFISLPGILLVTGRYDDAKNNIMRFAGYEKNGLIPNRIQKTGVDYNTADASMWFIYAVKRYLGYTSDWKFMQEILPVLQRIVKGYKKGTSYNHFGQEQTIKMDENDGLIASPKQATWMDADPSGKGQKIVTPRNGKTVEINALWYANLRFLALLENNFEKTCEAKDDNSLADDIKKAFNKKFWNPTENALYDVIEGDQHKGAIRPNMVIAVSHGKDLLPEKRQIDVVNSAKRDLLTPAGLRTLSPRDSNYKGEYNTYLPIEEKDLAYHQGTAWPWLIGPFSDASARTLKNQGKTEEHIRKEVTRYVGPLVRFCMESPYKSLPEVFSGDEPYIPGGTTSQAWSIAEVLRTLVEQRIVS